LLPGQGGAVVQQGGLVGLDDEQVVGLLAGDQELGGVGVALQGVGGDDPGQVQPLQQWLEGGDLARGAVDLALGQHRAGGVVHRRQQVDLAAVWCAGTAERLAVDRDGPAAPLLAAVAVGQPGANRAGHSIRVQAGKGPADGGLGRDGEVAGAIVAGAERGPDWLRGVGGPFGDRGHRAGPGQHRGRGHGQDGDQRVAAAAGGSRVGDGGQVGEQVGGLGLLEGVGVGELGQRRRDRR
jgi:hypothetical protein